MIDLPLPERWELTEVPDRLTRLIKRRSPLPPPPPVQERRRGPKSRSRPKRSRFSPKKVRLSRPTTSRRKRARHRRGFSPSGRSSPNSREHDSVAQLGAQAHVTRSGEAASGRPQRSRWQPQAPGSSAGDQPRLVQPRCRWRKRQKWRASPSRAQRVRLAEPAEPIAPERRARIGAHGRGDPDRIRPPQGRALPALQPGAAPGPDLAGADGSSHHDRARWQRVAL